MNMASSTCRLALLVLLPALAACATKQYTSNDIISDDSRVFYREKSGEPATGLLTKIRTHTHAAFRIWHIDRSYLDPCVTGLKRDEIPLKAGLKHGTERRYDLVTGRLEWEKPYVEGLLHGVWKDYFIDGSQDHTYISNGRQQKMLRYWPDGTLQVEEYYENGEITGLRKTYHADGKLESVTPYGEAAKNMGPRRYYADGTLESEAFRDQNGWTWKHYNERGILTHEEISNGPISEYKKYDDNGNLLLEWVTYNEKTISEKRYEPAQP